MSRPAADISELLGLTGWGARGILVLYAITFTSLAVLAGGEPMTRPEGVVSLILTIAAAGLVVAPGPYPLPLPRIWLAIAVIVLNTFTITWYFPSTSSPGYSVWNWIADSFLLFGIALRGRLGWAWIGAGITTALILLWSWVDSGDPWTGFFVYYPNLASLFAGSFFAFGLKRTAEHILEFQELERRRIADDHIRRASAEQRAHDLARIRESAGPALTAIASGSVTEAERVEHRLLEASLRDGIRGRALAIEPLVTAARNARSRGIDVVLLDDSPGADISEQDARRAASWAAAQLPSVPGGVTTVRLAPENDRLVVTVSSGVYGSRTARWDVS